MEEVPPEKVLVVVLHLTEASAELLYNVINEARKIISEKYPDQLKKGTLNF